MDMHEPSMQAWQEAWAGAERGALQRCYSATALVIPPGHATLRGPEAIVDFFQGGFNSIIVRFFAAERVISDRVALETGIVRDFDRATGAVVEVCDYAVTWVWAEGGWQIAVHTWSVPLPGEGGGA